MFFMLFKSQFPGLTSLLVLLIQDKYGISPYFGSKCGAVVRAVASYQCGAVVRAVASYQCGAVVRAVASYQCGAVVRAVASHQCGPDSNHGLDAICGLTLLLVLSFAPRVFPREWMTKTHFVVVLPLKRYFVYLFICLFIYLLIVSVYSLPW